MDVAIGDIDAVMIEGAGWTSVNSATADLKVLTVHDEEGHSEATPERALIWQSGNRTVAVPLSRIAATRWNLSG